MDFNPTDLWKSFHATVSLLTDEQKKRLVCELIRPVSALDFNGEATRQLLTEFVDVLDEFLSGKSSLEQVKQASNQNLDVMHSIDKKQSFYDAFVRECHWAVNVMISECCSAEFYERGWIYSSGKQKVDVVRVCRQIQWIKSLALSGAERDSSDNELRKKARNAGRLASFQELEYQVELAQRIVKTFPAGE